MKTSELKVLGRNHEIPEKVFNERKGLKNLALDFGSKGLKNLAHDFEHQLSETDCTLILILSRATIELGRYHLQQNFMSISLHSHWLWIILFCHLTLAEKKHKNLILRPLQKTTNFCKVEPYTWFQDLKVV